ncbi:MAG: YgcG family protein [Betaproteobacteria bacterium]|nr:YgcG family protein [Betaproteobacteria bacterium]
MAALSAGRQLRSLLIAALLLVPMLALADVAVPPLKARVTDLTGTLDAAQKSALEQKLAAFEARKGAQVAVLMLPTTQPETIEQYAVRVEEKWKLGRKGVDDGVLLVIAKEDRKLRIEVGYGLEGVLPDAVAKRIIADDIAPRFKQGDFYGGVTAGVERITRVIDGEALPPPKAAPAQQRGGDNWNNLFVIGFVVVFVVGGILRAIFGRFIGAGIISVVVGIIAWSIAGVVLIALIAAIIAFIFAVANGGSGGGFSSGGGGFSSDSGGGFSGGGGSSGGGGASGSW